jgi:hypothetical protein
MRGKTLIKLLDEYRSEARVSMNPAHNAQQRDPQIALLQRIQEWLWNDFTWPHLRVERFDMLQAGQRYYDTPDDMDIDRIEKIEVRDGTRLRCLLPGIDEKHLNAYDPVMDVRVDPARRWRISEDEQVEIWPLPATDADPTTLEGQIKFTGIRTLRPLVADADKADLDNRLIVLYAAAETLAASGAKDANLKLSQANKLYAKLRGNLMPRRKFKMFGNVDDNKHVLRGPPSIYYRVVP